MSALALEMQKVSKRFDATQALNGVSIALQKGETHALVRRNGAGESTLIKIMAGIHPPDERAGAEVVA
jgi:ribose transport system ATP-binding protein